MPKNNGRVRKAWRKELADKQAAAWAKVDSKNPEERLLLAIFGSPAIQTHLEKKHRLLKRPN